MTLAEMKKVMDKVLNSIKEDGIHSVSDEMVAKYNFLYYALMDEYDYDLNVKIVSRTDFIHHRKVNGETVPHEHDEFGNHVHGKHEHEHEHDEITSTNYEDVTSLDRDYYIYNGIVDKYFDLTLANYTNLATFMLDYIKQRLDEEYKQEHKSTLNM